METKSARTYEVFFDDRFRRVLSRLPKCLPHDNRLPLKLLTNYILKSTWKKVARALYKIFSFLFIVCAEVFVVRKFLLIDRCLGGSKHWKHLQASTTVLSLMGSDGYRLSPFANTSCYVSRNLIMECKNITKENKCRLSSCATANL